MTLRHMKIYVAVFHHGNITKAAEELHLAQPSVSLAIRELEEYYGIRLFERMGRRILPTEGGKEFYGWEPVSRLGHNFYRNCFSVFGWRLLK